MKKELEVCKKSEKNLLIDKTRFENKVNSLQD